MRTNNIEIHFKLPININKPDDNGVIYTEEAIKNACEKASNKPIIAYNEKCNRINIYNLTGGSYPETKWDPSQAQDDRIGGVELWTGILSRCAGRTAATASGKKRRDARDVRHAKGRCSGESVKLPSAA
jgi:hypothetical protein